jgi:hypothetical protein
MGRTDAVAFTSQLVAEWRRLGAEVTLEPGWDVRGNGYGANYEGAIVHHTGFGSSEANPFPARNTLINGRPDLTGPLCNSAGPWCTPDRPRVHVISARPANHAGASGGRSMGPLPVTGLFNPRVWGHEIDYGGNVAMAPGQYVAALIVARGVANVLGRSTEYVRAHAETSVTGKWDPGYATDKTIDMAAFRRDAANFAGVEGDMQLTDRIGPVTNVRGEQGTVTVGEALGASWEIGRGGFWQQQEARISALTETVRALASQRDGIDVDALLAGVEKIVQANRASLDVRVTPSDTPA